MCNYCATKFVCAPKKLGHIYRVFIECPLEVLACLKTHWKIDICSSKLGFPQIDKCKCPEWYGTCALYVVLFCTHRLRFASEWPSKCLTDSEQLAKRQKNKFQADMEKAWKHY